MSDDDAPSAAPSVVPVAVAALAGVVDPSGKLGVGVALVAHYLANATSDAAWRRANLADAREALSDGGATERGRARAGQPFESENEFEQHRRILEWMQEDLADVLGRVENLEVVALGMLHRSEALLRKRSDPEMRPYLLNIWRNSVRRSDYFNGTWMDRCVRVLEKVGADHLKLLCSFAPFAHSVAGRSIVHIRFGGSLNSLVATADQRAAWEELVRGDIFGELQPMANDILPLPRIAWRVIELVSEKPLELKGPSQP